MRLWSIVFEFSIAPADYAEILQVIPLGLQSQNITIPVTIEEDTALESTEDFTVNITSTDEFVAIGEDTAQVFIVDNGELKVHKLCRDAKVDLVAMVFGLRPKGKY